MSEPSKKQKRSLFSPVVFSTAWLTTYCLLRLFPYEYQYAADTILRYVLDPLGVLVAVWLLFFVKRLRPFEIVLPLLVPVWFFASNLLRGNVPDLPLLMRTCTYFVIWCTVYWYGRVLSSEGMKLQIVLFLRLLCMVTAVMLLFGTGLRFYLNRKGLEIENAICSLHGRLSLFGMHANTIGAICSICILFGIFLLGNCPKRKRILHVCQVAVFTVCLLMTDSRTCEVSLAACLGLLLARTVFLRCGGGVRRVLVSLAVLIVCTSAAYGAMYVSAKGVSAAYQWAITWSPRAVRGEKATDGSGPDALPQEARQTGGQAETNGSGGTAANGKRTEIKVRPVAYSNTIRSRIRLWEHWLGLFAKEKAALFIGTDSVPENMEEDGYDPHNAYISTLVHYGLPAALLFMAILLVAVRQTYPAIAAKNGEAFTLAVCCLFCLLNACMESVFFYSSEMLNILFSWMLGACVGYGRSAPGRHGVFRI